MRPEVKEECVRILAERPNTIISLTPDGEIAGVHDFFPLLSAKLIYPDRHDPFEWARCLTDEEIVALPAPKQFPFLED